MQARKTIDRLTFLLAVAAAILVTGQYICAAALAETAAPAVAGTDDTPSTEDRPEDTPGPAAETGRIAGLVRLPDGTIMSGITVDVAELSRNPVATDVHGRFVIDDLPPGRYTLRFQLGEGDTKTVVEVLPNAIAEIEQVIAWNYGVSDSLTVYSASRRPERIVDAPAAVSIITVEQIEREASTGQLPKLLESTPGVEITQSGLFDFKLNARGNNASLSRRVAVLIDGRDPSLPMFDIQEWAATSFPLDDLARAEMVRGPSSALYGANAFNGVLNLTTKSPRDSQGGRIRLAGGDLSTSRLDFRYADALGGGWYFKGVGGYQDSKGFTRSRNETLEYSQPCSAGQTSNCLTLEAVPIAVDGETVSFAGLRFDKVFENERSLVIEGGTADIRGVTLTTSGGRVHTTDVDRPWARMNFNSSHWNLLASYTGRTQDSDLLATGTKSFLDNFRMDVELRTQRSFSRGRGRFVAGIFAGWEDIDTADPAGNQTLLPRPADNTRQAAFAQLDYTVTDDLKLVLSGRWDDSELHTPELSPRIAAVYSFASSHSLRVSYGEGFQPPNYPERLVRVPLLPPVDLSIFETFCAAGGTSCGFDRLIGRIAVGNEGLEPEKIKSAEVGYTGIFSDKALLSINYYQAQIENYVGFLPQLGSEFGRVNPDFGPYTPPSQLPAEQASALLAALEAGLGPGFPFLSNGDSGEPVFVLSSVGNFGLVDTQGLEISLDYALGSHWRLEFNYSWLDFDVRQEFAGAPLESNSPENQFNVGLNYADDRFSGAVRYRWVDAFQWAEGITLRGPVPSYGVVNLVASYDLSEAWEVGVNVSNLFNDRHYEIFSGDLLERYVLGHVSFSW